MPNTIIRFIKQAISIVISLILIGLILNLFINFLKFFYLLDRDVRLTHFLIYL